ncbi:MAG TPA: ABC transporter permease [Gaiellaceae bacterium]|nr:ABC transporter permease [Gaiellaceae bacterium]
MIRLFIRELRTDQRLFWRSREAAFFTFLLPIILLVLLGSVYGDEDDIEGIRAGTYLLAGLLGYGVVSTAFASLAISLVIRRESGVLKRIRGTPLPTTVYLAALLASTLVIVALEAAAQLAVGRLVLDAGWPTEPGALALALVLGSLSFAALGLALTGAIRSAEGSSAVVNAVYLPATFICGVFFSVDSLPRLLEALAGLLPLTYLLELIRDAFTAGRLEASSEALAVLAGWGALGALLALRTFRWEPREA